MITWIIVWAWSILAIAEVVPSFGWQKDTVVILMAIASLGIDLSRRLPKKDGSL